MLENSANEYSSQIKLVDEIKNHDIIAELMTFPNQPIIWSLVEGHNKAKIYESLTSKAIIIVENRIKPLIFIAGELSKEDFNVLIKLYSKDAFIYCSSSYHRWFVEAGWEILPRIHLSYNGTEPLTIPDKLQIKPIDNLELFKQCQWFDKISEKYINADDFLKCGEGYALCDKSQVIAEIYNAYFGRNYVEIGIFTHPNYRKQGAAAAISSYFVNKCIKEGKIPVWSCRTYNLASLKTALKIGFQIERYYVLMVKE